MKLRLGVHSGTRFSNIAQIIESISSNKVRKLHQSTDGDL